MYFIKNIFYGFLMLLLISDVIPADVRLCGKTLTQFLDMVCVDGFNSKILKAKKSDPLADLIPKDLKNKAQTATLSSLFMDELYADANNLIAKTRRRRYDGVADECCRKPCSMPELLPYCI